MSFKIIRRKQQVFFFSVARQETWIMRHKEIADSYGKTFSHSHLCLLKMQAHKQLTFTTKSFSIQFFPEVISFLNSGLTSVWTTHPMGLLILPMPAQGSQDDATAVCGGKCCQQFWFWWQRPGWQLNIAAFQEASTPDGLVAKERTAQSGLSACRASHSGGTCRPPHQLFPIPRTAFDFITLLGW